jgi:predicted nucleic acid-binding protein
MSDSVLLDTSFLIALSNPAEPGHAAAQSFFRYFEEDGILMFLSTIAAAEFYQRQSLPRALFEAMIVLPFNHDDAQAAAHLDWKRFQLAGGSGARAALKDDFKLLGQAKAGDIPFVLTADDHTLARFCAELRNADEIHTAPIRLSDGFDKSYWDPARQRNFDGKLEKESGGPAPSA